MTLENLIAGGGSSSESLSLTSIRFAGALLEYPWEWPYADTGEFRRRCGRGACWTAAIKHLSFLLTQPAVVSLSFPCTPVLPYPSLSSLSSDISEQSIVFAVMVAVFGLSLSLWCCCCCRLRAAPPYGSSKYTGSGPDPGCDNSTATTYATTADEDAENEL